MQLAVPDPRQGGQAGLPAEASRCCSVGVLALPYSFSSLTWGGGPLLLALCCVSNLYTCHILAALHQTESGKRFNTYAELGAACLGEPLAGSVELRGASSACLMRCVRQSCRCDSP